eukprot:CAMPEP_0179283716 /NCGR_PEP_ID=MMETSP0797-20121207/38320_1 /TAXON_ID=47934 /ORGANISM="Dinophysis acuminata, Strain DAEP01" /LENGTH=111 /DNA_ID=CAMNT_0020992479 /DNA_START=31 /DNA_END=366 /DNA_ORIENTATION=+
MAMRVVRPVILLLLACAPAAAAEPTARPAAGVQPGSKPPTVHAKDHVMLQASLSASKAPPKLSKTSGEAPKAKEEACQNFDVPQETKGTSRLQKSTVVKKVILDLEEDDDE